MSECIEVSSDSSDTDSNILHTKKDISNKKKYEAVDEEVEAVVKKYISENFYTENENDDIEDYTPLLQKQTASNKFSKVSSTDESLSQNDEDGFELELQRLNKYKLNSSPPRTVEKNTKQEKQIEKQKRIDERNRKKREAEQEKCLKKALAEANKNVKPTECMKFIRVQIDSNLMNEDFTSEIVGTLEAAGVEYTIEDQLFPNTISWYRKVQIHCLDDNGKLILNSEDKDENEVLLVMTCKNFIEHVNNKTLSGHIQSLQSALFNKRLILIIYGLHNYYRSLKNQKQKEMRSQLTENISKSTNYQDIPQISRKQIEFALLELQIHCSCSYRTVDSPRDLGLTVAQFTKAVAEIPFKQQRHEKFQQADWFVAGDNRDTVKVDKNGNGLNRLWNQMLTSFPLARLEIAEAISSNYPTLSALMEAYENCTNNPELLLQDIQIRRAAGPLSSTRKIGPELSKKVYNFFNSIDGNSFI